MVPQLSQVETLQTVSKHVALSVAAMEAPKKKPRVDKQGRATANYVQRTLETLHHAREQHIYSRSWPSSVFHDTLRPSDKAGWFAAAYFVLSLLQAQLQAFWHWVEESPLPVGAVATTDCITFLMQLKQRNPSLGKIPPALIAALAWVHPHVQIVSTWSKSATEVLRTQLKSAVRSIKQSVGASASSSTTAAAPMPPTDPKAAIVAHRQTRAFLKNISEKFTDGSWTREFDSRWIGWESFKDLFVPRIPCGKSLRPYTKGSSDTYDL